MATIIGVGLVAGLLIGSIGIGGVIVVPALTYIADVDIHHAVAAALMGFCVSGLIGTIRFRQFGIIDWSSGSTLAAAAVPGTLVGTLVSVSVSAIVLKVLVAIAVIVGGLQTIFAQSRPATEQP